MPYATDRKDKMFTAYNLNTLYSRFDAKCRAALNEMGPLWAQSRFHPFDQWSAPFPYGVWYVYRNDPETAMRLHDDGVFRVRAETRTNGDSESAAAMV